jgi:hypothetical protein
LCSAIWRWPCSNGMAHRQADTSKWQQLQNGAHRRRQ